MKTDVTRPRNGTIHPALDTRRRTVIYGAGAAGRAALSRLNNDGARTVVAFADGDPRKQGTTVDGVRVVALDGLPRDWFDEVVVAVELTPEQQTMLERVRAVLGTGAARPRVDAGNGVSPGLVEAT